jgi:polysaccharide biosynthesis PFTS motif protein
MRGIRRLKAESRQLLPVAVMATLTTHEVRMGPPRRWLMGAASSTSDLVARQYLLRRVMGSIALNSSMLQSIGTGRPVVHPLPAEWRKYLRTHGLEVAGVRSAIAWWGYVGLLWVYGVSVLGRILAASMTRGGLDAWRGARRYVYFVALTPGNTPRPGADGRSHDIVSWYWNWKGRASDIDMLAHSVPSLPPAAGPPVRALPACLPPLTGWAIPRFAVWGMAAAVAALWDLCLGRWGHAVLLSEAAEAASVRLHPQAPLAVEYCFHASNPIYRPLWTYEAEARGSGTALYCYSTNSEGFKTPDGYTTPLHSWQVMTWPRILVWDEAQADFMRRAVGDRASTTIVGTVWFESSPLAMPDVPPGAIAVFDVQPQRVWRRQTLGLAHEFYTPRTAAAFIADIVKVAAEFSRPVVFKRKRRGGPLVHRGYLRMIERFTAAGAFTLVDPDISAVRVIESCDAVISMPFTSTALIARADGVPSVYFDPLGLVQPDDRAAHGVPVVHGIEGLRDWFRSLPVLRAPDDRAAVQPRRREFV